MSQTLTPAYQYRHHKYNYALGVINGSLFLFGVAFLSPTTVLPDFIHRFTGSKLLIGLAGALHVGGWYLPQILAAGLVERFRKKKTLYIIGNSIRMTLTLISFVAIFSLYQSHPGLALGLFMSLFGIANVLGGFSGLCFMEMVGALIPSHRRGSFFSTRFLIGGSIFSVLAGHIIHTILSDNSPFTFPQNYMILFGLGWSLMVTGIVFFCFAREDGGPVEPEPRPIFSGFRQAPHFLKTDPALRRLVGNRILAVASRMSWPFFIIFAREDLHLGPETVGIFLICQTVGGFLGNLCWGKISEWKGDRFLLRLGAVFEIVTPLYAGAIGVWLVSGHGFAGNSILLYAICPVFFLLGLATFGSHIAASSLILETAPEETRPTYIGIINTISGVVTFLPLLAGLLAEQVGLLAIFFLSAFCAVGGLVQALRMPE